MENSATPVKWTRYAPAVAIILLLTAGVLATQWGNIRDAVYGAPPDAIAWRTDLPVALADAAKAKKPALLDFTASWCPPCKTMKRETWPDASVQAAVAAGVVPVLLDIDLPAGKEAAQKYDVRSIPTLILVDAEGNELRRSSGMIDPPTLVKFIAGK